MRAALWLVGLFAAAVALALFAGDNEGTVTVFWPPHRVDLSVNLALLLLVGLFVLLHLALRALSAVFELPRQARRWRAQQRERATHAMLLDAFTQFSAGRFLRARKAAEGALAREQALQGAGDAPPHALALRTLAHMTVAESAHAHGNAASMWRCVPWANMWVMAASPEMHSNSIRSGGSTPSVHSGKPMARKRSSQTGSHCDSVSGATPHW